VDRPARFRESSRAKFELPLANALRLLLLFSGIIEQHAVGLGFLIAHAAHDEVCEADPRRCECAGDVLDIRIVGAACRAAISSRTTARDRITAS